MERDALYYPNIHIHDVEWLKRALLIFPHVVRMVPQYFDPRDDKQIRVFERAIGRGDLPLLRRANLWTQGVQEAQLRLAERFREDLKKESSTLEQYNVVTRDIDVNFRIHQDKTNHELVSFLLGAGLARRAERPGWDGFLLMHPKIGEAIMSTLAIACAKDEGFDVVTGDGELHHCIMQKDGAGVYDALVKGKTKKRGRASAERLLELVIYQNCDARKLSVEALVKLTEDREAIEDLTSALKKIADTLPSMQNEHRLNERLQASVNDVLRRWERDKANMTKFSRQLFGSDAMKPAGDFFKKIGEKFFEPPAVGALAGGLTNGTILGASAGLAIGILVHGAATWQRVKQEAKQSPYRYLTAMEKAGVAFTLNPKM